jgi:4-amino-4-deoxy-L-arabinose transferase-like glycosyltransferase
MSVSACVLCARTHRTRTDTRQPPPLPRATISVRMSQSQKSLLAVAVAALLLRVAMRLLTGAAGFWDNGYSFYVALSKNIAAGNGFAFDGGEPTAFRVPLYPMFLAAATFGHRAFLSVVIAQSFVGMGITLCGAILTADLFGRRAGVVAGALIAVYPYFVVHDTAIQETSLFTLLTLLSVIILIRACRTTSDGLAAAAGLVLALAVLTRATIAPFAALAPLWLGFTWQGVLRTRVRAALICVAVLLLGVSPWLVRSYLIVGSPTLGTETGLQLWAGNSSHTFSHYPAESIDLSVAAAVRAMSASEKAELKGLDSNEVVVDRWFTRRAVDFIALHPWVTVASGFRKVGAAFSWLPSPRRSFWPNLIYVCSYGPIMVLGVLGMFLNRGSWKEQSLIYALFLSFMVVTAVFFGHTSHRSFLDVYLIAYAAYVIDRCQWSASSLSLAAYRR